VTVGTNEQEREQGACLVVLDDQWPAAIVVYHERPEEKETRRQCTIPVVFAPISGIIHPTS
jgi:hypothetical protein